MKASILLACACACILAPYILSLEVRPVLLDCSKNCNIEKSNDVKNVDNLNSLSNTPIPVAYYVESLAVNISNVINGEIVLIPFDVALPDVWELADQPDVAPLFILKNEDATGGSLSDMPPQFLKPTLVEVLNLSTVLTSGRRFFHSMDFESITEAIPEFKKIDLDIFRVRDEAFEAANRTDMPEEKVASDANTSAVRQEINSQSIPARWWLLAGSGGTALQARFSEYHTVKLVLAGTCRFTLYAPKFARHLYPFPSIHAANSQSQVNIYDLDVNKTHPSFKRADPISVVLTTGSLLYVPPFWHVHVEELSLTGASFGIDILSVSAVQSLLAEAHSTSLPLRGEGLNLEKKEHRVLGSMVFLVHVMSRVVGIDSPVKFAKSLLKSRFSQLYPENSLYFLKNRKFVCYQDKPKLTNKIINRLDKLYLVNGATLVADKVNSQLISQHLKYFWLSNYIEQIARWAMNDPEEAVLFIKECLNQKDKIEVITEVEGTSILMNPE